MEIEIFKENTSTKTEEIEYLKVTGYSLKVKPDNLLFVTETSLTLEDKSVLPTYEIQKIQFIASCKTRFQEELLIAFYIGEYSALCGFIISELPSGYYSKQGYLIDYKSYIEICDLTGETKLSLVEYIDSIKMGICDINTFVKYKDKYLNRDEQEELT